MADQDPSEVTPCSQSQIGRGRHLREQGTAPVEAVSALSVVVRSGPVRTAVNGTLVARPVRTTSANPDAVGSTLTVGEPDLGDHCCCDAQLSLGF
jgi:hypothetical protein